MQNDNENFERSVIDHEREAENRKLAQEVQQEMGTTEIDDLEAARLEQNLQSAIKNLSQALADKHFNK